ncbi:glycosyltransferase family 2 protein [Romeria aff. gracilis LEGE 07310]|uniref:Glycosyltransferase family 2 protein n=2 Tax=Vasconcelosia TaxID=3366328 RepID=A0A8J7DNX1_9CYAN|nr:glycosyltransferase family 2 protein [Romeria aff. gracilis LEGE 07310]
MTNQLPSPRVTIVVVPRERFSCAQRSLESVLAHTQLPYRLVYVDGNSPAPVRDYLKQQADAHGFELLRTEQYLYPNQARNLGLAQVETDYVVFLDNDVIVSPNWLTALLNCAEETGAAVVGPLMCQYEPIHEVVHFAGGETHIWTDKTGRRRLREKMYDQGKRVADVRDRLQRTQTELAEFHCVLVRRSIFEQLGPLDGAMLNTKEHLDFCLSVRELGDTVYFEPDSIVTYVPGPPLQWSDLHYYMLRWSDAWTFASLKHLQTKWNLAEDGYFQTKYKKLQKGWRRRGTIIGPFVRKLTFGLGSGKLESLLVKPERLLNQTLTTRHAKHQPTEQPSMKVASPDLVSSSANR